MGLSFRKSIQILPGVKINLSKSGVSVSAGVSGLHASINSKGQIRGTASIPGTGIRYSKSKKLSDLIPSFSDSEKKESKASKDSEKEKKSRDLKKSEASEASGEKRNTAKQEKIKKGELSKAIMDIYAIGDRPIEWIAIKNSSGNIGYENWEYLKERADKVLNGDIDTYLELISDVNPFDELIAMGCNFSCGTDNPMKMSVECSIGADTIKKELGDDRDLTEDLIAGIAIKSARDIFALLPLWQVEITAVKDGRTLLNAKFQRDSFEVLNFERIDASDTVRRLGGIISV